MLGGGCRTVDTQRYAARRSATQHSLSTRRPRRPPLVSLSDGGAPLAARSCSIAGYARPHRPNAFPATRHDGRRCCPRPLATAATTTTLARSHCIPAACALPVTLRRRPHRGRQRAARPAMRGASPDRHETRTAYGDMASLPAAHAPQDHNYPSFSRLPAASSPQPMTRSQIAALLPSPSDACSRAAAISSECKWAPASFSISTCSARPAAAARKSGVLPLRLRRCTDAPCSRKSRRISTLGPVAAKCCAASQPLHPCTHSCIIRPLVDPPRAELSQR